MTERELLEMPRPERPEPAVHVMHGSLGRADAAPARVGRMASALQGSSILRIAAQVRTLLAEGRPVANFTVGDFSPKEFPVPKRLIEYIAEALEKGETNYPPSSGMPQLRAAVARFYEQRLDLRFGQNGILIAAGARPAIYSAYRVLVDPGDRVVFPVPSWNNFDYCHLVGAQPVPIPCDAKSDFLPTAASLTQAVRGARMLVLNSPVNPTGSAFSEHALRGICDLVLEENARRAAQGWRERPLFVLYDQVYWMLTFGETRHVHPVQLRPDMAEYTVYVDAISKSFAATGVRVGWVAGPDDVMKCVSNVLSHSGAWAPRAEQLATARLLEDAEAVAEYHREMLGAVRARLDRLHEHLAAMHRDGLPVEVKDATATIYLSARFALTGKRSSDGAVLRDDEAVRSYLLERAGLAAVPFTAFGVRGDSGWFRLSVGAVSLAEIEAVMPRLREAIAALSDGGLRGGAPPLVMPELPDITAYLEALAPRVLGQTIERLEIVKPFVLRTVDPGPDAYNGTRVTELRRLGKRIALGCAPATAGASAVRTDTAPHDRLWIVMHLMIAGRLRWRPPGPTIPKSLVLTRLHFPSGVLHFTEAGSKRRASLHLVRGDAALQEFERGGLEVLDAPLEVFAERLRSENHTLKRALTDPRLFSGIGNAYSDEILHTARLSPLILTSRLTDPQVAQLHAAAQSTLRLWIARLTNDARAAFPEKVTAFREGMAVHGRYGQPCPVCAAPVQRIRYADNETNYCARCQTEGRLLADRALSRLLKQDWPRSLDELA